MTARDRNLLREGPALGGRRHKVLLEKVPRLGHGRNLGTVEGLAEPLLVERAKRTVVAAIPTDAAAGRAAGASRPAIKEAGQERCPCRFSLARDLAETLQLLLLLLHSFVALGKDVRYTARGGIGGVFLLGVPQQRHHVELVLGRVGFGLPAYAGLLGAPQG